MLSNIKTAAVVLLAALLVSCAGSAPPVATPAAPTKDATAQPKSGTPSPAKEVLVPGAPDSLLANPEPDKSVNIEFVLDASGSMLETIAGKTRVQIAKEVMADLVRKLPPTLNVGLRVYGHRIGTSDKVRGCQDIQLLTPLGQGNQNALLQQIQGIQAAGWTPIARSLDLAAQDMAGHTQNINNIVLLSDGEESCDGKPIETAQQLKDSPATITVHTVAFATDEAGRKQLQEIAAVSGGTYNEAQDADGLLQAMERALLAARSGTFLRGEVTGEDGRRVGTSVWLQDPQTNAKLHEFRTWIDSPVAPGTYDILVGTAPRVLFPQVVIRDHTKTALRLSTGGLRVEMADPQGQPLKALAHLLDRATGSTLRSFPTWYNQPALPGSYDLLIEANPTVTRRNISVAAQKLTVVDLGRGTLRLDVTTPGGGRPNWEAELRDPDTGQAVYRTLVGRELPVLSGPYQLVILSTPEIRQDLVISPGEAMTIKLQTGLLRVDLLDASGQRARVEASLIDASKVESGRFSTWEEAYPLPGSYELVVHTQPQLRRQVQVSPTDPTILRLRSP